MVEAAGGDNVFSDVKQQSVQATTELILARRPDVDPGAERGSGGRRHKAQEIGLWRALDSLPAVRNSASTFSTIKNRRSGTARR
jgi:ABC-type Fe3+-hydroxamate transport system substrate-binding protein